MFFYFALISLAAAASTSFRREQQATSSFFAEILETLELSPAAEDTPFKVAEEDPLQCFEDEVQHPCKGQITITQDEPNGCDESMKTKYGWVTLWICVKCDKNDNDNWKYGKDLAICPYFQCGKKPLCGHVEAFGKEEDLTPKQMKCLYETRKPKKCGF